MHSCFRRDSVFTLIIIIIIIVMSVYLCQVDTRSVDLDTFVRLARFLSD